MGRVDRRGQGGQEGVGWTGGGRVYKECERRFKSQNQYTVMFLALAKRANKTILETCFAYSTCYL